MTLFGLVEAVEGFGESIVVSRSSPTLPTEGSTPASARRVRCIWMETYWADLPGRRNDGDVLGGFKRLVRFLIFLS